MRTVYSPADERPDDSVGTRSKQHAVGLCRGSQPNRAKWVEDPEGREGKKAGLLIWDAVGQNKHNNALISVQIRQNATNL